MTNFYLWPSLGPDSRFLGLTNQHDQQVAFTLRRHNVRPGRWHPCSPRNFPPPIKKSTRCGFNLTTASFQPPGGDFRRRSWAWFQIQRQRQETQFRFSRISREFPHHSHSLQRSRYASRHRHAAGTWTWNILVILLVFCEWL